MIMDNGARIIKIALAHHNGYVLAMAGVISDDPETHTGGEYVVWRVELDNGVLFARGGVYFHRDQFDLASECFRARVANVHF